MPQADDEDDGVLQLLPGTLAVQTRVELLLPLALAAAAVAAAAYAAWVWRRGCQFRQQVPQCLTWRLAIRLLAWGGLITGLAGLASAAKRFLRIGCAGVPQCIFGLTLASYALLGLAPLLAAAGLRLQAVPKARKGFRQAAKAALLAGLAAGQAVDVLCNVGEQYYRKTPMEWRSACSMLGASTGIFLLGLWAAHEDGQASRDDQGRRGRKTRSITRATTEDSSTSGILSAERDEEMPGAARHDSINSQASLLLQSHVAGEYEGRWSRLPSWSSVSLADPLLLPQSTPPRSLLQSPILAVQPTGSQPLSGKAEHGSYHLFGGPSAGSRTAEVRSGRMGAGTWTSCGSGAALVSPHLSAITLPPAWATGTAPSSPPGRPRPWPSS
mmetsp:Transcript_127771/g.331229  ORF Transcript_127771/g.331229 Transcript_127771/m.331229 type:complete len:384 (+) Transcript_127771:2-1153(+)